ncbi:hypothetical protein GCM10009830_28420 [Glycomyces endophyticus]|uniref:Asp23/Gls24 family envelope stress response protein n=1 Tax=Glycomyces endophyticus TaxID=480996 RepID=A0ABN2GZW9_9ACTN
MVEDFAAGVDAIAAAVRAVPGVSGLHGGPLGEVAVLLPGRRVPGLRLGDAECEVHVAVHWDTDIPRTAAAVHAAVAPLTGGRPVAVTVEDVDFSGTGEDVDFSGTGEDVDFSGAGEGVDSADVDEAAGTGATASGPGDDRVEGAAAPASRTIKGD